MISVRSAATAQRTSTAAQLLTFVAAFLGLFSATWYLTVAAGGLALAVYVASLVLGRHERRRAKGYVDEIAEAVDLSAILRETASPLGLRSSGSGWRISLYRLEFDADNPGGLWKLEARASDQKSHEISEDLSQLSLNQSVLRTAVVSADRPAGGVDEMPPLPDPTTDHDEWIRVMSAWGLDAPDLSGAVRSRSYAGCVFRVGLSRGKGRDMTLGLIAECQAPGAVTTQALEQVLTRPVFELFYELIRLREDMQGSLSRLGDSL